MDQEREQSSEESFATVAEYAPIMLWRGDQNGKCIYLNHAQREFWGVAADAIGTFSWASTLVEADAPLVFEPFAQAMSTHEGFQCEARYRRSDGAIRILLTRAEPRFSTDGVFTGMVGVNLDVTEERLAQAELKRADERRTLLLEEMRHRIKNLMATVLAIAGRTARSASSIAEFNAAFQARLGALAKSHDLLLRDENADAANLSDIVRSELEPYLADSAFTRSLNFKGEDLRLNGRTALAISLILHELATNAAKYGAFSQGGAIDLNWRITEAEELEILWSESGGPVIADAGQAGFGSTLIDALARGDLKGSAQFDYDQSGLKFALRFPSPATARHAS